MNSPVLSDRDVERDERDVECSRSDDETDHRECVIIAAAQGADG